MGRGYRSNRLGEEIRKVISEMLISELKDPRLSEALLSISSVDVTRDGSYATCYVTVLVPKGTGYDITEEEREIHEHVLEGLYSAKGLIKKEIGSRIKMRHIPELIFKIDGSMDYGRHISKMLKDLDIGNEEDEK